MNGRRLGLPLPEEAVKGLYFIFGPNNITISRLVIICHFPGKIEKKIVLSQAIANRSI